MKSIFKLFTKTHHIVIRLNAPHGVHLRPSAIMAGIAKKYSCQIMLSAGGKQVDVKNMNAVLALGLQNGDHVTLKASGKDSPEAIKALQDFLLTLCAEEANLELTQDLQKTNYEGSALQGVSVSTGIAVGMPYFYEARNSHNEESGISFEKAYKLATEELESLAKDNDIFIAQKAILESLPHASHQEFITSIDEAITSLKDTANQAKIADYQDIQRRVAKLTKGAKSLAFPKTPFLLIADELLPSDIPTLIKENIQGVIVRELPPRAHAALLLRSYKIPAISLDIDSLKPVDSVMILDASQGLLVTVPTKSDLDSANNAISAELSNSTSVNEKRFEPAITKSGKHIKVLANITDVDSAMEAKEAGCEGVGLLRTEFLFRETKPTFDKQVEAYKSIFSLFDEVTVRTLDVGGDKNLPYLTLPRETNPFLGVRGIRLFETHLELMEEQLLAILKAKQNGELKIMFPMVATVEEFNYAKGVAHALASKHSVSLDGVLFGIMVEVPSVLFLIEEFNKVVDFYSIGTNDLTQYLFAIDRTHATLSIDPHSSVLYDAIRYIQDRATKPVSTCGEIASNCDAIEKLVQIGIDTLGVTPAMIPTIKARIRDV
ncbi:MAG: HPr family phosphocarrier protein [Campylobacterales bacterium]|nr:HPr family phosphocarrier protein [Campylobacterales bacterium]